MRKLLGLFSNFGCTIQIKMLIKYPTFADLSKASDKEIDEFLKTNKYRRQGYIDKIIQKIRKYRQLISEDVEFAYRVEAMCLCNLLIDINAGIKEIETEMNIITDEHRFGKVFKSLPGAGNILACKLLALFGDNKDRFYSYNGVQCLFGTAPKNYQSGTIQTTRLRTYVGLRQCFFAFYLAQKKV